MALKSFLCNPFLYKILKRDRQEVQSPSKFYSPFLWALYQIREINLKDFGNTKLIVSENRNIESQQCFCFVIFCQPDEEEARNGFPATSRHTRKSNSFDAGTVRVSHTVGLFLLSWYAHYACCSDSLLLSSVIANNGALPFFFDESSMLSLYLMCSQAGRARWLCTAPLSCNPPPQPPLPTPYSVSVSCHFPSGMEPEGPYDLGRSSDRRFPVKKPCFPQYRNRSLDCPAGTRCMYLFHLLLGCAAWRPCCMRGKKKKKGWNPWPP